MSKTVNSMAIVMSLLALPGLLCFSPGSLAWEGHKRAPWVGTMFNGTKCDGGQVPFGPYDYLQRNMLKAQLEVVEESHFNEEVESLKKGMSASAMGDIHYTLQTWPNHHRALNSAFRYRLQHKELWASGDNTAQNYPAECYLQRAIKFSPNDPIPYMLHGMLMHQMKQYAAALKSYREAIRLRPDDLVTQYNMGLTLVELKQYQEAQQVADKVYAAEFPLPGLQRKLAEAKKQKAKAQVAQAKAPDTAADAGADKSAEKSPQAPTTDKDNAQPPETPLPPADKAVAADLPGQEPSKPPSGEESPGSVANAASENGVTAEHSTAGDTTASKPAPKLTEEQLAILRQALKDQAAKKSKAADSATP